MKGEKLNGVEQNIMLGANQYLCNMYRQLAQKGPYSDIFQLSEEIGMGQVRKMKSKQGIIVSNWNMIFNSDMNVHGTNHDQYINFTFCIKNGVSWEIPHIGKRLEMDKGQFFIYQGGSFEEHTCYNKETIAAIEIAKDMTQLKELSDKINALQNINNKEVKGYRFNDIITNNKAMLNLIEKAKKASNSKASVLITGETGSGKELFAQSIHYDGIRRDKPFVAINCAAIPSSLLESTLFGTVKGSFTGAEDKQV